jgi:putative spermidine/putrescine transport system permease protein
MTVVAGKPSIARRPLRRLQPSRSRTGIPQILPAVVFIFLLFNIPLVLMLSWSIGPADNPFATYEQVLITNLIYMRVLGNTFFIALLTTAVCCLLGYPFCYWLWTLTGRLQLIVVGMVILTFWVSILVRTYAWIVILGNAGVINRFLLATGITTGPVSFLYNQLGVIIGTTNVLLPFLILPLFAAMVRLDNRLFQAAASLGASRMTIFWRIFFPLTLPALAAGAILVFILTLGFFITPAILGGGRVPMIANMMDLLINRLPRWELAAAISTVLLCITLVFFAAYQWINRRQHS